MSGYGFEYGATDPMNSGGGAGGGFGNSSDMSSPPRGSGRKSYDEQTLIPVTIRMCLGATTSQTPGGGGGSLSLPDGRELHQVKLVGAIRSVEEQSTNITYQIEDGTGLIDVKQWLDAGDNSGVTEMRMQCKDHTYVRIIGQLKDYDGKRHIMGYSVRRVSTGNELTHHMLEVIYSQNRGKTASAGQGGMGRTNIPQSNQYGNNNGGGAVPYGGINPPMAQNRIQGGNAGVISVQDKVLEFIRVQGEGVEVGADINDCISSLSREGFPERDVRQSFEALASEGQIYSTIDETKYKYAM
mmetsp:Transcript_53762/g.79899  ORF Transcript_53762/g.79899 Transcript_53762/m.79899 type:complete len:298 (-) Transcript_53762:99-992(-)|eukprot:CAMPEP_0195524094 /NCGR_PEP_ID=MMETSP0794_2-20130614/23750_1 /TAXON_ID=515487 /ORGANISM="Stephanopyxis turris, Strain CCMP 815" /LENGTH=297 /DNA_ID=CAMNT_0040654251 /DNA_START=216 /DNA_END=1109 /DNA_ORIENTATION=+